MTATNLNFYKPFGEVFTSIWPFLEANPKYRSEALLERLVEPERAIQFRVAWTDDKGQVQVNRAFRRATALAAMTCSQRSPPGIPGKITELIFLAKSSSLIKIRPPPRGAHEGSCEWS